MTITLAGLSYHVLSPSLFQLATADATLAYDGRYWLVAVEGICGTREFKTRDQAAALVAHAFTTAKENLG